MRGPIMSAAVTAGTSMRMSMRSRNGPESRALVVGGAGVAAPAGMARRAGQAAFAGVHRGDQLEPRREGDAGIGAGDHRLAALERLAQAVEHRRGEFRQLVEEQHAVMGQADTSPGRTFSPPPTSAAIEAE